MQKRFFKQSNQRRLLIWARWILRCYPRAWRKRYAEEMRVLLQEHPVSLWTLLDLLRGALDAHLHPNLLPGEIMTMAARLRTSEIVIFCTFIFYACLWFVVNGVRDPLSVWEPTIQAHPAISLADSILNASMGIALLAVILGGVPVLLSIVRQAFQNREWRQLVLLSVPLVAVVLIVVYGLLASGMWAQRTVPQNVNAPLTPLAIILQVGFLLLLLVAVVGSSAGLMLAVRRSQLSERLVRFALLAAAIVTLAMVVGTGATLLLSVLILTQAPQVAVIAPAIMPVFAILMGIAAALAINALQRGRRVLAGVG